MRNTVTNSVAGSTASGADGSYRFDALPLGSFAVEYVSGGHALAREYFAIVTATDVLQCNLVAVGTGTVAGMVRNPDATPAAGQAVSIRSLDRSVGGFYTATTDASGAYSAPSVPAGDFFVRVSDSARVLYGEGSGTLTPRGVATADITLQSNSVPMPQNLWDANNRLSDIQGDGRLLTGDFQPGATTFNGASSLEVAVGSSTARFLGEASGRTELGGGCAT